MIYSILISSSPLFEQSKMCLVGACRRVDE